MHRDTAIVERGQELAGSGQLGIRDGQRATNDEWRAKKVVDGPNAFGDEEALAFARLPALEVSRYREHAHGVGTEAGVGP